MGSGDVMILCRYIFGSELVPYEIFWYETLRNW